MSNPANFQEWETVVLRKSSKEIQKKNAITETVNRPKNFNAPKVQDVQYGDIHIDSKVSPALRKRVLEVRVAQQKPNNTQSGLASSINVPCDQINKLEAGSLSHKEAKQIVLKIERRYKVKILENL